MGCSKSSAKREVYSTTLLPQETRNISNKQPNLTPKAIRWKLIIKIRAVINEIENRKSIEEINKNQKLVLQKR